MGDAHHHVLAGVLEQGQESGPNSHAKDLTRAWSKSPSWLTASRKHDRRRRREVIKLCRWATVLSRKLGTHFFKKNLSAGKADETPKSSGSKRANL